MHINGEITGTRMLLGRLAIVHTGLVLVNHGVHIRNYSTYACAPLHAWFVLVSIIHARRKC